MNRTANVAPIGYAAFALTLWMNSMIPAGWFDASDAMLANLLAFVLGGCTMGIAGILRALQGHAIDSLLFLAFAAFWWVGALTAHLTAGGAMPFPQGLTGWYHAGWAFLAFCIWLAACRDGVARMLFVLGLCLSLLAFTLADWTRLGALTVLGGYLGLVAAVVGFYVAAAELVNETHGHVVLPLGENGHAEPAAGNR